MDKETEKLYKLIEKIFLILAVVLISALVLSMLLRMFVH